MITSSLYALGPINHPPSLQTIIWMTYVVAIIHFIWGIKKFKASLTLKNVGLMNFIKNDDLFHQSIGHIIFAIIIMVIPPLVDLFFNMVIN